ncbi:MAG: ring-cleaving dioxygenase [Gemmatimonadota bacterium]
MNRQALGIHHITAIAADPQRNLDFYAGLLGLRFVKRTVNFDDPSTYHFYFGDEQGAPGTILTFFPWPGARRGRVGPGQVGATAFAVPAGSLDFWRDRLRGQGVRPADEGSRFGEAVISFEDPDGLRLELIAAAWAGGVAGWQDGPVPAAMAVRGFHSVTLWVRDDGPTASVLTGPLGFEPAGSEAMRHRFTAVAPGVGGTVDLLVVPTELAGSSGAGTVHHVAWRAADDAGQLELRTAVLRHGLDPTPVIDRTYFHSIYFREPGGVLFEIATDNPGFAIDEPAAHLGEKLMLPEQFEGDRAALEALLPPLVVPGALSRAEVLS